MAATNPAFTTVQNGFNAQAGRFFRIRWNGAVIGGCQSIQYSEATGVAGWIGEIGSDYKEPDFTMRMVSGTVERLALNKRKVRDILLGGNEAGGSDIDFRQFQFTIEVDYNEIFTDFQGKNAMGGVAGATGGIVTNNGPYKEVL